MGRKLATAIAALGAFGTGYMQGKKMTEDQEWEKEKRQREREAMARQDAERQAASDTIAKVGTQTVDPEQAGRAVGVDPSLIAKDIADFGPEGAKATVNPATIAAAGIQPDAVKTTPYSREQATGDYIKRMYAINPDKAAQVEGQQMQLDVARDGAETRGKLKRVDGKLRAWGEKTFKTDDSGNPIIDDQGMVHMGKMRSFLLSQEGLYDEAMKTADNSMKYAVAKIQADQVERQAAVRDAVAAAAQGDFTKAMETYKRFVPDGANATNVVQQKDGTIVIERESAVDGAKLPNQTFKSLDQFVSSLNALSDSKALTEYIDRTFRRDIDSRRLNLEGERVGIAREQLEQGKRQLVQTDDGTFVVNLGGKNTPASVAALQGVGGKAGGKSKAVEAEAKLLDDVRATAGSNMKGGMMAGVDPELNKKLDAVTAAAGKIVAEHKAAGKALPNSADLYTLAVERATQKPQQQGRPGWGIRPLPQ